MKKIFFIILGVVLFFSCDKENKIDDGVNAAIDESIIGTWRVVYSQTIDSVMMGADGSLSLIGMSDTTEYNSNAGERISSYMFSDHENIIAIREDSQIKVYYLNNRGGITITNDYIPYRISNGLLIYNNRNNDLFHNYQVKNDTLMIERIPDEKVMWKYKLSKYVRTGEI